jgi:hypothetical protein
VLRSLVYPGQARGMSYSFVPLRSLGPRVIVAVWRSSRPANRAHPSGNVYYSAHDLRIMTISSLVRCSPESSLLRCQISYPQCWVALSPSSYCAAHLTTGGATDETSVKSLRSGAPALNTLRRRLFQPTSSSPVLRLLSDSCIVAMALIDKVPGELKLYIGGYVIVQTTVSTSPTIPAWGV